MGLIAASMRLQTLIAYKNQLEMRIQSVTESMVGLQSQADELVTIGADLDPDSDALKDLKVKKERLNLIEKKLEMQQKQFQTQLEAITQEIQSCQGLGSCAFTVVYNSRKRPRGQENLGYSSRHILGYKLLALLADNVRFPALVKRT